MVIWRHRETFSERKFFHTRGGKRHDVPRDLCLRKENKRLPVKNGPQKCIAFLVSLSHRTVGATRWSSGKRVGTCL